MLRRTVACLGLITALFFASNAHAQFSQYLLPIERGVLESHIEAQYQYSKIDLGPADLNVGLISLEGQYNFGSFEVGINIPFVTGWITNVGDDWQLGDIMASVKAKVFGISDIFGLAVFGNFYLPTHSGDFTHSFFACSSARRSRPSCSASRWAAASRRWGRSSAMTAKTAGWSDSMASRACRSSA